MEESDNKYDSPASRNSIKKEEEDNQYDYNKNKSKVHFSLRNVSILTL